MTNRQKVSTCLWFDDQAEAAATFYTSLMADSEILSISRYGPGGHMPEGLAMMVEFTLGGARYQALNGGPTYQLSPAVSLSVSCEDQAEIDRLWTALSDGGREQQCFWITDRFGLSWQIVPRVLGELMSGPDKAASARVMAVVMGSVKADIAALEAAHRGD